MSYSQTIETTSGLLISFVFFVLSLVRESVLRLECTRLSERPKRVTRRARKVLSTLIYINNIDDYCLNHESTIIDGLKALNAVEIKLAIVVDDNGSIIRTLSDGDIRRAMVSGFALDTVGRT